MENVQLVNDSLHFFSFNQMFLAGLPFPLRVQVMLVQGGNRGMVAMVQQIIREEGLKVRYIFLKPSNFNRGSPKTAGSTKSKH